MGPSLLELGCLWWDEIQPETAEQLLSLPQPLPRLFAGRDVRRGHRAGSEPRQKYLPFSPFPQKSGGGQRGMDFKWLCKRSLDESKSATTEKIQST